MWNQLVDLLKAPVFPGDEERTRHAHALNALHINMGGAVLSLGSLGVLFVFREKQVASLILLVAFFTIVLGIIWNRRGHVKASGPALVKRFIEFHGGQVWVENEVWSGSTFYFAVPRAGA